MSLPTTLAKFIWYFVKKQKACFIAIQVLALAWAVDNTAWPFAMKLLIDKLLAFTGDKADIWVFILPILIFWALLWLTIDVMFRIMGFLMAKVYPQFEADIRMSMFEYVTGHSYEYFANNFAGNISNRVSDMTQSATRIMQQLVNLFIPAFVALLIAGVIFFTISPLFALLLVGWACLHIGICLVGAKKCSKLSKTHSESRSYLTGKIVDSFSNIINVKLFAKRRYEYSYINQYQEDEKIKAKASLILVEKIKIFLSISAFIFPLAFITWYAIYNWQHDLISMGDLVLIFNTTWNIQLLAWIAGLELPNLFKELGVCQQALSVIQAEHDVVNTPGATPLSVTQGNIIFEEVNFQYIKDQQVFTNFSVDIAAGSKVGLVGFSGSGKSSFVHLIMRFFDINTGKILIDGQDISQVTLESLCEQVSMIPQNPSLFHRSLLDNIRYGKQDATMDEVLRAAKHAHCHEFIESLPDGYDSLVGERGIKLSGGQRQRVAIARAILEDAPILILDEATSALDSVTEKHIQDALHYLMKGRTTIVVAHRLSTLAEMDRILVFDHGDIIEDGDHDSLLKKNGHYARMWHMQAGGFLPDSAE